MKIALLGYGKMGKVIEQIALQRGHEIVLKKTELNSFDGLLNADVAIDFSVPDAAVANISECLNNAIPVISGTTGWLNNFSEMETLCTTKKGSFIYSSNFSLGVNLFFQLNENLAKMMSKFSQYKVNIEEIHHTQKLDTPSGTASPGTWAAGPDIPSAKGTPDAPAAMMVNGKILCAVSPVPTARATTVPVFFIL